LDPGAAANGDPAARGGNGVCKKSEDVHVGRPPNTVKGPAQRPREWPR
jgi:hypothetical protein